MEIYGSVIYNGTEYTNNDIAKLTTIYLPPLAYAKNLDM
jgi:hypothetical protein